MIRKAIRNKLSVLSYRFRHWLFSWQLDNDGDMGLLVAKALFLVKYKEHTIVKWLNPFKEHGLRLAPKHGGFFNYTGHYDVDRSTIHFSNMERSFAEILTTYVIHSPIGSDKLEEALTYFAAPPLKGYPVLIGDAENQKIVAVHLIGSEEDKRRVARLILEKYVEVHSDYGAVILPTH